MNIIQSTAPTESLDFQPGNRRFMPMKKARKPKQPKFIIRATGPFMEIEVPVYSGTGITALKRIKRIHNEAFKRQKPELLPEVKEVSSSRYYSAIMRERIDFYADPKNRLVVQIINPAI